jgi:hypothetical protein
MVPVMLSSSNGQPQVEIQGHQNAHHLTAIGLCRMATEGHQEKEQDGFQDGG